MSKRKWIVLIILVSLLATVAITRKISPKWYENIEKYPRDIFVSLSALFGARNDVIESIKESIVSHIVADKLLNLRELSEIEKLQLHLYYKVAPNYNHYLEIKKVVAGESGWRVDVYGDSGMAYGVGQFWESTFYDFVKESGIPGDYKNPYDQLTQMAWGWKNGKQSKWTVWRDLKKSGEI